MIAVAVVFVVLACLFAFTAWKTTAIETAFPPQGRFVVVPGGRMHVTERQPKGRPRATIVLLHGASANQADIMEPLGDRLAALGFYVVAPDRPGHGWSDPIEGASAASPAVQAKILRGLFEAMGVKHAIVVGHSWSGALAVNFALDQADFTQGLVLISPADMPWPGGVAWYNHVAVIPVVGDLFAHTLTMPTALAQMDGVVAAVFAPRPVPPGYVARSGAEMVLRPKEFIANARDIVGLHAFVTIQAPRMATVKTPTAIITGDADSVVLPKIHAYGTRDLIPGSTLTVMTGVGHSPHHADPDRVVGEIDAIAKRAGL